MQKNELITLIIEDIGTDGLGIGRHEGMAFFVKDALIGDKILAKIIKLKKNYGYARLIEIQEASPDRVKPRCIYARSCGGCQIQEMDYGSQLAFKQKKARSNLIRLGGFDEASIDDAMEPVVGMDEPFAYRNKAQFPIGINDAGELVAGFYAGRTHSIIANTDCALGVSANQAALEAALGYMNDCGVSAYDEKTGRGLARHVLIRYGFDSKEIMVCVVVNGKRLPQEEELVKRLCRIPGMASISLNVNEKNTNVILGESTRTIWGKPVIEDALYLRDTSDFKRLKEKRVYRISPQSFYQVSPVQAEKLYSLALEYAGLTGQETVWDLYCGIGTISLFLAGHAKWVYGVEVVPQAIEDARENARLNGIGNVTFLEGKAEDVLAARQEDMCQADVIVVDPPRKGCDKKCIETMLAMRPEKIVYVSCDSATLARDAKMLCDGGYEIKRWRAVDQFAHTVHCETVVKLSLKKDAPKIEVTMEMDSQSNYVPEDTATYRKIKDYVKDKHGLNVSNLYIAQIKDKCGLEKRENYNLPKSADAKVPQCPPEKEEAILDAFRHFGLI